MIVTARQLEELHREGGKNGCIALRAGTRLSPLARDWLRNAKVEIDYVDGHEIHVRDERSQVRSARPRRAVWWCDGPCPVAKAALMVQEYFVNLRPIPASSSANQTAVAVRQVANEIATRRADAGVLLVQSAGAATVHANRLPELRAVVGTTADSLDAAIRSIRPNVLILEHSGQPLVLMKNLLARFVRGGGST
ncbi:hypothetical protein BH09PLA1_BH09PLA1_11580 [soil metagenome]